MAIKQSIQVRNARLATWVAAIGPAPVLELRSGLPSPSLDVPAGDLLAVGALPMIWMGLPRHGVVNMQGEWLLMGQINGWIGHYRVCESSVRGTCHEHGTVALRGDLQALPGDMQVDMIEVHVGQAVTVTQFTRTAGNG